MKSILKCIAGALVVTGTLASCRTIAPEATDLSLTRQSLLGDCMATTYAGFMPDDSYCLLTIYSYANSGDGLYSLQLLTLGKTLISREGKRVTLRGNDDATLWLCANGENKPYIFLRGDDIGTVYAVDNDSTYTYDYPLMMVKNENISRREFVPRGMESQVLPR